MHRSEWDKTIGTESNARSRSRKVVIPTLPGTSDIALGVLQQPQFKLDEEKVELVWQRVFRGP